MTRTACAIALGTLTFLGIAAARPCIAATLSGPMDVEPTFSAGVGMPFTAAEGPMPTRQSGNLPSDAMLATIVAWLSYTFQLPPSAEHPSIKMVPASHMVSLRYRLAGRPAPITVGGMQDASPTEIVALFDDATRTIFLPDNWTGSTPGELSVLVHEMVHYLQNQAGLKYNCPEEREQLAYAAQERWLNLFGRNLVAEFETDPFTLLLRTRCAY